MKRFLFLLAILFTLPTYGQSKAYKAMLKTYYNDFPTISLEDAYQKIGKKGVYFLDTREDAEFKVSHIKTARQVGYDHFDLASVRDLKKDAEIIVYCSIGARSQGIGEKLKIAGFTNVKNLYGGLFHWVNSDYPIVDSNNNKTDKIHGYSKLWGKWVKQGTVVY